MSGGGGNVLGAGAGGAAMGAAIGTMIAPGAGTAIGAAAGGGLGLMQGFGQAQQAAAMQQMASAQLAQEQADRQAAMSILQPTQAEIQQLQQALAINQQSIGQAQQLIASSDPALVQAGQQALALMQGQEAASLNPLKNQRAQQRSALEAQLASQLGPGYRTSSAGIQALNNFDQQTSNLLEGAQQQAIGQYMGYAGFGAQLGRGQQQTGIQNISGLTGQQYGWQQSMANAITGQPINPGLAYTGQLANAQANVANMGTLMGAGMMYGMGQMGKGPVASTGGAATPLPSAESYTMPAMGSSAVGPSRSYGLGMGG